MKKGVLALGLAVLLAAPAAEADDFGVSYNLAFYRVLGVSYQLAGRDLNGTSLNGEPLKGHGIAYVSLDGIRAGTEVLPAGWLDGSELMGGSGHGRPLSGSELAGAVFIATVETGTTLPVRIDAVQHGSERWDRDVFRYTVSYQTTDGWLPLCGSSESGPVQAIALQGRWDYGQGETGGAHVDDPSVFTFACVDHSLGKCVEMGYKPWQRALACKHGGGCERTTLAAAHQACTRMLRADYCGDGTSYTVEGTEVNAYDVFGVRTDALAWASEAEWGPGGATCVARERLANGPVPPCLETLARPACGQAGELGADTLLISEVHP
jgi:hypothetical protein